MDLNLPLIYGVPGPSSLTRPLTYRPCRPPTRDFRGALEGRKQDSWVVFDRRWTQHPACARTVGVSRGLTFNKY